MKKAYLQSITSPIIKFEILGRNKDTNVMQLRGAWSEFEEVVTKEYMEKYKYKIVVEEVSDV